LVKAPKWCNFFLELSEWDRLKKKIMNVGKLYQR